MRQNSVEADIAALKYVNLLSIREMFYHYFQKSVGHMTWKLLRKIIIISAYQYSYKIEGALKYSKKKKKKKELCLICPVY